jgi:hypothetical protein
MLFLSTTLGMFPSKGYKVVLPLGYCSFYQFSQPTIDFDPQHDSVSLEITTFDLSTHLIEFTYSLILHSTTAITIDHGTVRKGYFDLLPDSSQTFSCTVNDVAYDNAPSSTNLYAFEFYGHSHRGIYTISTDGLNLSFAINPGALGLGTLSLSDPGVFISGQANLGINSGIPQNVIFTSSPSTSTGSITITEFDTVSHLVSGTFGAHIKPTAGDSIRIDNGHFQHMRWFDSWE